MLRKFVTGCLIFSLCCVVYMVFIILSSKGINEFSLFLSFLIIAVFVPFILAPFLKEARKIRTKNR